MKMDVLVESKIWIWMKSCSVVVHFIPHDLRGGHVSNQKPMHGARGSGSMEGIAIASIV
jgi:hypothetical protein